MEGKIKSLKGQVDFATVDLNLSKDQILGPLGYVIKAQEPYLEEEDARWQLNGRTISKPKAIWNGFTM